MEDGYIKASSTIPQHLHIKKLKDKPILIRGKDRTVYKTQYLKKDKHSFHFV